VNEREELEALRRIAELEAKGGAQPGVMEDVAKSVPSGAAKGMINLAGAPADLWEFLTGAMAKGVGQFTSPEFAEELKKAAKPELPLPNSKRLRGGVESVTGPLHEPQTRAGKFTGGVMEATAAGVPFGKAATALSSIAGLSSETAGAVTDDNPWAKAVAGFFGPMAAHAGAAYRSAPGNMIRQATGDVTEMQWEAARKHMEKAKALGIDLAAPEAMPTSSIQQLASDVAASKEGGRVFNRFLANRPPQVANSVNSNLLSQIGIDDAPDVNMARAKDAATGVISQAEKARSAAVRPHYQAARRDVMPPENIQAIMQQIDDALPYMAPEQKAAAEAFRQSVAGTSNAAALNEVYKTTRNKIDLPAIGATPEQKTAAGALKPLNASLDDSLKFASPNIRQGRETYRQITEDVIEPLTSGPIGRVAGKQGFDPSVPQTLNPVQAIADAKVARPENIRELYTHLNKQDPKAFPGIAKTYLENAFDQAAQKVQAGDNRMVGANFAKAVFGTPQEEANLLEVMRGVAKANGKDPDELVRGTKNLMEILQSTGKIPGAGSPTGGRLATNEMARKSGWLDAVESVSATPTAPITKRLRDYAMGGNYRRLAEILTAPDSIDQIIKIGKYKPSTVTSQALAIGLLESTSEAGSGR
jgi:hypothetical protein